MTPFKERMNLYRAYREQNPGKNYWDWKASLEVPAMVDGGNTEDYQPTSEIPTYWDEESQSFKRGAPRVIGMSGADPIGEAYVGGKAFAKGLEMLTDAYKWKRRTDAVRSYRDWLGQSAWNNSNNVRAKALRETVKKDLRAHGGEGTIFDSILNDLATGVRTAVDYGEKLFGFENGGVVSAMTDGGGIDPFLSQFGNQISYRKEDTGMFDDLGNWWNDLTGMKNYAYGYYAVSPSGKHTTQCAKYSHDILRNQGYKNITGDAWNRASYSDMTKIASGYDGSVKPKEYSDEAAHQYLRNAAANFAEKVDTTHLEPYDVIGLYYPDSPNTEKAFRGGAGGETQTHTGHTIVGKDGTHYVVHNVDGHLKINKLADMLTGEYDYLPVSAYRPKK